MKRASRVLLEAGVALVVYAAIAAALTWPMVRSIEGLVVGGGEFGGWLWRQWWHFQEVDALAATEMGAFDLIRNLVGLGRYPETGNILDVLLLSYPIDQLLGFPWHHNLKVLLILVGNGLCAYALARTFTESPVVALAAGTVALANPLVIQDINGTGLRQVLLWWLLLFPISLRRAMRTTRMVDGIWVGVLFSLVATFYWFYGLFAAMFAVIAVGFWVYRVRPGWRRALRWMWPAVLVTVVALFTFLLPYFAAGQSDSMRASMTDLPELSFFLTFPAFDTIASAPLRPSSYEENVLSSLRRVIVSAWPADYVINPFHGVSSFPALVVFAGVLPGLFIRRARVWVATWALFWVGTMGPFLKFGADRDATDVVMLGEFVVRLPYAWMFKWVPGMSRMFAPYRMSSMMVVAGVVLVAIGLGALSRRWRIPASLLVGLGVVAQPFWHIDVGPVAEGSIPPPPWRIPTVVSPFAIPNWYKDFDSDARGGIIELPLEQQQDLMCVYQVFHGQKVYRSWAGTAAVPPLFRTAGGGEAGERMRWLAEPEPIHGDLGDVFLALSRDPMSVDPTLLHGPDLVKLMDDGGYRWLNVHERGYFLVDPHQGDVLYRDAIRRLGERLDLTPLEVYEYGLGIKEDTHLVRDVAPAWIPMAGKDVSVPLDQTPRRQMMAIFDLSVWRERQGDVPGPGTDGDDTAEPTE
jgi:hypothetical protein